MSQDYGCEEYVATFYATVYSLATGEQMVSEQDGGLDPALLEERNPRGLEEQLTEKLSAENNRDPTVSQMD